MATADSRSGVRFGGIKPAKLKLAADFHAPLTDAPQLDASSRSGFRQRPASVAEPLVLSLMRVGGVLWLRPRETTCLRTGSDQ